jgi:hypothetical protein
MRLTTYKIAQWEAPALDETDTDSSYFLPGGMGKYRKVNFESENMASIYTANALKVTLDRAGWRIMPTVLECRTTAEMPDTSEVMEVNPAKGPVR